jgi:glycosyltransferase involved in cell wall biosynthesis
LEAKEFIKTPMPPILVQNWGNDIYFFGRIKQHRDKVRQLVQLADYYHCECERDIHLAKNLGLKGKIWPVFPISGGLDLENAGKLRVNGLVSQRKQIMVKGYQGWSGRALVGLQAIELCAEILHDYKIVIFSSTPDVQMAAELVAQRTGLSIECLSTLPRDEVLRNHGRSRIYMGVSVSDGACTSMLEAMMMGAFPLQSYSACVDEWFEDGKTGIRIASDDPRQIADSLMTAISNDKMVNEAAEINWNRIKNIDVNRIKPLMVDLYKAILFP